MSSTLFISDLHLSEHHPHLTSLFKTFLLNHTHNVETLYILGDFFELWIGDDAANDFQQTIISLLQQATTRGLTIYLMPGNRDFLLSEAFTKKCGCMLLPDPSIIQLYGHTLLLKHGDDLCLTDKKHLCFRRLTRNKLVQKIFLSFPLIWRKKIAQYLRRTSKGNYTQLEDIDNKSVTALPTLLSQYHARIIIHGHIHMPIIHYLNNERGMDTSLLRIVLSDWEMSGNFLSINSDGTMRLQYFELNNEDLGCQHS